MKQGMQIMSLFTS